MDLRDRAVAEERKYMELAILNQQNSVANVSNLPKSRSIITPMTKEMIQDYKDTLEVYGKKGGERLYNIPDIDLDLPVLQPVLTEIEKQNLLEAERGLADNINRGNQRLIRLERMLRNLESEYNEARLFEMDYVREKNKIEIEQDRTLQAITDATTDLETISAEREQLYDNELENKAEMQKVDRQNKEKLRIATDIAKMQNSELKLESQGANESNEEYADRIANLKNIVQPEIIKDDAEILVMERFRRNMIELIRNKAVITQILQILGITQAFEINKIFPLYKKRFLEIYGYNNTSISAEQIADSMISLLDKDISFDNYQKDQQLAREIKEGYELAGKAYTGLKKTISAALETKTEKPSQERKRKLLARKKGAPEKEPITIPAESEYYDEEGVVNSDYLGAIMSENPASDIAGLHFIIYQPPSQARGRIPKPIYMMSETEIKGTFKKANWPVLERILGVSKDDIITELAEQNIQTVSDEAIYKPSNKAGFVQPGTSTADIQGWGIKTENIPEIVPLGKIRIKPRKLYYDNILVIKDHKGGNIPSVPNVTVSDNMTKLLFKILKNQTVSDAEVKELVTAEQNLYNLIIRIAELHKIMPHTGNKTIASLKKHLELIEGEIEAGNNNPKLLKDAKTIVKKLYSFAVITPKEANNYIQQLKEIL